MYAWYMPIPSNGMRSCLILRQALRSRGPTQQTQDVANAVQMQLGDAELLQEIGRHPHRVFERVPTPTAHTCDALGFFELGLLLAQLLLERFAVMHIGMCADHAQRAVVGSACYHATAIEDPAPLTIVLTQPEFGHIRYPCARPDAPAPPR